MDPYRGRCFNIPEDGHQEARIRHKLDGATLDGRGDTGAARAFNFTSPRLRGPRPRLQTTAPCSLGSQTRRGHPSWAVASAPENGGCSALTRSLTRGDRQRAAGHPPFTAPGQLVPAPPQANIPIYRLQDIRRAAPYMPGSRSLSRYPPCSC